MVSFTSFALKERYKRVNGLGDRLLEVDKLIDWNCFRPVIKELYYDDETGGRPHTDEVVLLKCLVLQSWYNLSDEELEYQIADRLSFQNFIGFSENTPDYSTIWKFRERLSKANVLQKIWSKLQEQLNENGFVIKQGVIQDATIIKADVGKKRQYKEKQAEKKNEKIKYSSKQKAHQDQDGSFIVKNGQVDYGYKLHQKCDVDNGFIRSLAVTTVKVHDSQIDLIELNDKIMYRDKGYAGAKLKHENVKDKTMRKAYAGKPLTKLDKIWNRNIAKKRAPGERPFAVIKNVFNRGATKLKNLSRITVQQTFNAFSYNLYNLYTVFNSHI